ncbi:MAG: DUF6090 family protein [Ignavibacteriaceae bacterium]
MKIFRNVRKQLASENRIMAYLRYAIGEIFLVVIGILIALQVNNWNENRKLKKQETIYLQDLSIDLKKQIQLQDNYIDFEDIIIDDCKDIVAHYEQNNGFKKMDSIFPKINDLIVRVTFTNANTTLLEMINSGEINIIENEALKKELMEFNQTIQGFASNTVNNNTNLVDQIIVRNVMKNSNFAFSNLSKRMRSKIQENNKMNIITVKDNNLKTIAIQNLNEPKLRLELINDIVFRNGLSEIQKAGDEKLKAKAKQLLKHIETELNQ